MPPASPLLLMVEQSHESSFLRLISQVAGQKAGLCLFRNFMKLPRDYF